MNLGAPRILDPVTRDAVLAALRAGDPTKAVRFYRLATGASTSDAKRAVESIATQNGIANRSPTTVRFPVTSIVLVIVLILLGAALASRGH